MEPSVDAALSLALHRLLKNHYGHDSFRPQQQEAVAATITGKDCLLILPTGRLAAVGHYATLQEPIGSAHWSICRAFVVIF
jgi:hypothetical protein